MAGISERLAVLVKRILAGEAEMPDPFPKQKQLSDLGLSSLKMVNLMLAVEGEFNLTIPPADITPENFHSLASIEALISRILGTSG